MKKKIYIEESALKEAFETQLGTASEINKKVADYLVHIVTPTQDMEMRDMNRAINNCYTFGKKVLFCFVENDDALFTRSQKKLLSIARCKMMRTGGKGFRDIAEVYNYIMEK